MVYKLKLSNLPVLEKSLKNKNCQMVLTDSGKAECVQLRLLLELQSNKSFQVDLNQNRPSLHHVLISTLFFDKAKQQYYLHTKGLFCGDVIPLLDTESLSWKDPDVDHYLQTRNKKVMDSED